jgi:hypothetical protein
MVMVAVKVLRPVLVEGERVEADEIVELPRADALVAVASGRVELYEPIPAEPVVEPPRAKRRGPAPAPASAEAEE